jgi:hypothetical protein
VSRVGKALFFGCKNLRSIQLSDNIMVLSSYFDEWRDSYHEYNCGAFYSRLGFFEGCESLSSLKIPKGVEQIDYDTFRGCISLSSISVDSDNLKYDSREDCNAIIETAENKLICGGGNTIIPETVTTIAAMAFAGCKLLKSIIIPNSIIEIGNAAFEGCSNLISITIPDSVTSIGDSAFAKCSSLESISIPDSVIELGGGVFAHCENLRSIKLSKNIKSLGESCDINEDNKGFFEGCSSLFTITIPESVTSIGDKAFYGCSALTSFEMPDSVTEIGSAVFSCCKSLISVKLSSNIKELKQYFDRYYCQESYGFFEDCTSLTSIAIPDSVTVVGKRAFHGCTKLKSLAFGKCFPKIEPSAFDNLTNMRIYLPLQKDGLSENERRVLDIIETNVLSRVCNNYILDTILLCESLNNKDSLPLSVDINTLKQSLCYFSSKEQIKLLRYLFFLIKTQKVSISIDDLGALSTNSMRQLHNDESIRMDLTFDIIINALISFSKRKEFLVEKDLVQTFIENYKNSDTITSRLDCTLFHRCMGIKKCYYNEKGKAIIKQYECPKGILFCEGRKMEKSDEHGKERNLCRNQYCYDIDRLKESDSWEFYTLYDMCKILAFNMDTIDEGGFNCKDGKYLMFIAQLNRFNEFSQRLVCENCGRILYPVRVSNVATSVATYYCCKNNSCPEVDKEIYISHCLNKKCYNIIDSRNSKKCDNGWYICSNCGVCCSHEKFKHILNIRLYHGRETGWLRELVENKRGHLEKKEYFCYKCGSPLTMVADRKYICTNDYCDNVLEIPTYLDVSNKQ